MCMQAASVFISSRPRAQADKTDAAFVRMVYLLLIARCYVVAKCGGGYLLKNCWRFSAQKISVEEVS